MRQGWRRSGGRLLSRSVEEMLAEIEVERLERAIRDSERARANLKRRREGAATQTKAAAAAAGPTKVGQAGALPPPALSAAARPFC